MQGIVRQNSHQKNIIYQHYILKLKGVYMQVQQSFWMVNKLAVFVLQTLRHFEKQIPPLNNDSSSSKSNLAKENWSKKL